METFWALLALSQGNQPVVGGLPSHRASNAGIDVFFVVDVNKLLRKQSRCGSFETPWHILWRHCNGNFTISWELTIPDIFPTINALSDISEILLSKWDLSRDIFARSARRLFNMKGDRNFYERVHWNLRDTWSLIWEAHNNLTRAT